jgi:hypothetical protein
MYRSFALAIYFLHFILLLVETAIQYMTKFCLGMVRVIVALSITEIV